MIELNCQSMHAGSRAVKHVFPADKTEKNELEHWSELDITSYRRPRSIFFPTFPVHRPLCISQICMMHLQPDVIRFPSSFMFLWNSMKRRLVNCSLLSPRHIPFTLLIGKDIWRVVKAPAANPADFPHAWRLCGLTATTQTVPNRSICLLSRATSSLFTLINQASRDFCLEEVKLLRRFGLHYRQQRHTALPHWTCLLMGVSCGYLVTN